MKNYSQLSMLGILIIAILFLYSCSAVHIHREGLEEYCNNRGKGYSEYNISSELFLGIEFLKKYSYSDGNFIYDYKGHTWVSEVDRAFAWLSYDEDEYERAKQDRIREGMDAINEGQSAYGFTFYLQKNWNFPEYFTAIGHNDARKTLVFIGFCCTDEAEEETIRCAETDFASFLTHYYGDWYDW